MKKIILAAALLIAGIILAGFSFAGSSLEAGVVFGLILVSIAIGLFWLSRTIRNALIKYTSGE